MKKFTVFLFGICFAYTANGSCSDLFNTAVFDAMDVYDYDLIRCQISSFPSRCANEAQLYFYHSLDIASASFEYCVNKQ